VYEKMRTGIWVFNGTFRLLDAWAEQIEGRRVFKFRLEVAETDTSSPEEVTQQAEVTRIIPTAVKLEVWKRDKGRCVECGSSDNLHFDHVIPWSRGGSSLTPENIQLLCARHNLAKHDRIQ
jgi:HNH endonuclease